MSKKRLYDVSVPIENGMPVWPGDPPVRLERLSSIAQGANANVSSLACGVHVGTHVDAPIHFLDGASTVESMPLDVLLGPAYVADLRRAEVVDAAALERARIPPRTVRLLLRTRNSEIWRRGERAFQTNFVGVDAGGAEWLVRRKIKLVAIDYLSVAPFGASRPTHEILLSAGVVIVEGVDLSRVRPGRYTLYCLPMKLVGSDGAPARVILSRS
jgi:arylformamidase